MSNMKNSAAGKAKGKQQGKQDKPSFRTTRFGVLPTSIDALRLLTMDAATNVALTAASAKLVVEMDAAGTRVFLADSRTSQMIGGPEDLSKLGGIRAFVTRERREASGIEIARVMTEIAYRASNKLATDTPGYQQMPLESSFGATVRPLLLTLERLEANRVKLRDNTNPGGSNDLRAYLTDMFCRVRNAYYRHVLQLTSGESKKGQLAESLFQCGVPEYVHTKITSQAFVLERTQELTRVLFPQDPSKGLAFSVKEWRNNDFLATQGRYIMRSSGALIRLLLRDEFVRTITSIDAEIGLDDETNPSVAKLLKARVHVVPPMQDSGYVTEPGSKIRGGWKFPSPTMDTPQGAITALGIAFLRIYAANLQSVDLVGDYYRTIVPNSVSRRDVSPTNNFYVQWENSTATDAAWKECVSGNGTNNDLRVATWRWIRLELRLSEKGACGLALANGLGLNDQIEPVLTRRTVTRAQSPDAAGNPRAAITENVEDMAPIPPVGFRWVAMGPPDGVSDLQSPVSAIESPLVDAFHKRIFPSAKKGKAKIAQGANLTRLGRDAKNLIELVDPISKTLAQRITVWLRGFSDERLQAAASKLALAQFDELFIGNEVVDDDDVDESEDESTGGAEV